MTCHDVIRQISDYLDLEIDAEARRLLDDHFAGCRHCTAIFDGTRNLLLLMGDDRVFALPAFALPENFGDRLRERFANHLQRDT